MQLITEKSANAAADKHIGSNKIICNVKLLITTSRTKIIRFKISHTGAKVALITDLSFSMVTAYNTNNAPPDKNKPWIIPAQTITAINNQPGKTISFLPSTPNCYENNKNTINYGKNFYRQKTKKK